MKNNKPQIDNLFFDLITFFLSFFLSFYRSLKLIFSKDGEIKGYKIYFYDFLNFIFKLWPSYFWKKPQLSKVISFPGDLINYLFFSKPKK